MESQQQLRRQLDGLSDLRTIVKTMKALSAASIRQYEQAAHALSGYAHTVRRALQVVAKDVRDGPEAHDGRPVGFVVFGSDHGLCGRFNEEVAEHALERIRSTCQDDQKGLVLAVGARVAARLEHGKQAPEQALIVPSSATQITRTVQRILWTIDAWTAHADAGQVHLVYNRRSRGKGHEPVSERLIPLDLAAIRAQQSSTWPSRSLPTFNMDRDTLLSRVLHQYLFVSTFHACAESLVSEHASRLAAMQAAERNLDERLEEVTLWFRRARQSTITSELLDVVSGYEALVPSNRR